MNRCPSVSLRLDLFVNVEEDYETWSCLRALAIVLPKIVSTAGWLDLAKKRTKEDLMLKSLRYP